MTQLKDKVVWITGASSGIGEALAVAASAEGAKLVLSARRETELQRVKNLCPNPQAVAILPLDLTDFDADAAAGKAASFFGPIDLLVNNAGISQRSVVLDTGMSVYRRIMELDFFACVALTKALLPQMVAAKSGHIVTISSVVGYVGTPLRSGYAAAKHALHGFYDALRAEVWRDNVKVTLICPGYIKTNVSLNAITGDGGKHGLMDTGQLSGMAADECARQIWAAVAADREEALIGATANLAAGQVGQRWQQVGLLEGPRDWSGRQRRVADDDQWHAREGAVSERRALFFMQRRHAAVVAGDDQDPALEEPTIDQGLVESAELGIHLREHARLVELAGRRIDERRMTLDRQHDAEPRTLGLARIHPLQQVFAPV